MNTKQFTMEKLHSLSKKQQVSWLKGFGNPKHHKAARRKRGETGVRHEFVQERFWYAGKMKQLFPIKDYTPEEATESGLIFRKQWVLRPVVEGEAFE